MNPLTNRDITGRFEVRLSEYTGRRYWWGWESGWKDATEIGENGVLTLDAAAFAVGTILILSEPEGNPSYICPGCGAETHLIMNGATCPACMGRESE